MTPHLQSLTFFQGLDDGLLARQHSRATTAYTNELATYTSIMAPIARSIKALEGRAANAADVYIFWLAIAASLRNLFTRDDEIDKVLAGKVTAIVNRRYKEFINDSPTDIYFAAFFLDPRKSLCAARNCTNVIAQAIINPKSSSDQQQWVIPSQCLLCIPDQTMCHIPPPLNVQRSS